MRYQLTIDFDCDEDAYVDHVRETLEAMLGVLPYVVDNVEVNHYVYEEVDADEDEIPSDSYFLALEA
jgi:hypothetical protein